VAHKLSWFSTDHVGVLLPKINKNSQKYQRTVGYPSTSWASCWFCLRCHFLTRYSSFLDTVLDFENFNSGTSTHFSCILFQPNWCVKCQSKPLHRFWIFFRCRTVKCFVNFRLRERSFRLWLLCNSSSESRRWRTGLWYGWSHTDQETRRATEALRISSRQTETVFCTGLCETSCLSCSFQKHNAPIICSFF